MFTDKDAHLIWESYMTTLSEANLTNKQDLDDAVMSWVAAALSSSNASSQQTTAIKNWFSTKYVQWYINQDGRTQDLQPHEFNPETDEPWMDKPGMMEFVGLTDQEMTQIENLFDYFLNLEPSEFDRDSVEQAEEKMQTYRASAEKKAADPKRAGESVEGQDWEVVYELQKGKQKVQKESVYKESGLQMLGERAFDFYYLTEAERPQGQTSSGSGYKVVRIIPFPSDQQLPTLGDKEQMESDRGNLSVGIREFVREGAIMQHCVGDRSQKYIERAHQGEIDVYSLRSPSNQPHCTWEVIPGQSTIEQIKGKQNAAPADQYKPMAREFTEWLISQYDYDVGGDGQNIGFVKWDETWHNPDSDQWEDIYINQVWPKQVDTFRAIYDAVEWEGEPPPFGMEADSPPKDSSGNVIIGGR